MLALDYWKTVTSDKAGFLDRVIALLGESGVRYCVIGGQGVNAFVEPVVSLDLDLAVAAEDLASAEDALRKAFRVERFPHSVNVSMTGSDLRVQLQTDPRYAAFVDDSCHGTCSASPFPSPGSRTSCRARCGRLRTRALPEQATEGPRRHLAVARGLPAAARGGPGRHPVAPDLTPQG